MELPNLIVARTFLNRVDAMLAQTALEAAGISALVRSDDCGGVRPHLWMGGVELLVPETEAEAAREVFDALEAAPPGPSQDDAA